MGRHDKDSVAHVGSPIWMWLAIPFSTIFVGAAAVITWCLAATAICAALLLFVLANGPMGPGLKSGESLPQLLGRLWLHIFTWGLPYALAGGGLFGAALPFTGRAVRRYWRSFWKTRSIVAQHPQLRPKLRLSWRYRLLFSADLLLSGSRLCLGFALWALHDFALRGAQSNGIFSGPEGSFLLWLAWGSSISGMIGVVANVLLLTNHRRGVSCGVIGILGGVFESLLVPLNAVLGPPIQLHPLVFAIMLAVRAAWLIAYAFALVKVRRWRLARNDALREIDEPK